LANATVLTILLCVTFFYAFLGIYLLFQMISRYFLSANPPRRDASGAGVREKQ
jgi:hypothetical protein